MSPQSFFLEYLARPQTAEMFFEDVLMALVFYGMPIFAENNKPRLIILFKKKRLQRLFNESGLIKFGTNYL